MIMGKHHPFFISPAFDVMSLKLLCRIQVNKGRNDIVNKSLIRHLIWILVN